MARSIALVDIGNTSVKVITLVYDEAAESIVVDSPLARFSSVDDWLSLSKVGVDEIVFASVRDDEHDLNFIATATAMGLTIQQVVTEQHAMGLANSYARVEKMGVDRWVAMLGAQLFCDDTYIVADAGTAITVDAVADGKHLGGWIAPGLQLAKDAVTGNTDRVTQDNATSQRYAFGNDTEACLHLGCVAQLRGMVCQASELMNSRGESFSIVVSGGDAELFAPDIFVIENIEVTVKPNIVLFGLLRFVLAPLSLSEQKHIVQQLVL